MSKKIFDDNGKIFTSVTILSVGKTQYFFLCAVCNVHFDGARRKNGSPVSVGLLLERRAVDIAIGTATAVEDIELQGHGIHHGTVWLLL